MPKSEQSYSLERMIRIRKEQPQDVKEIRELNILAFGQDQEAGIVDKLRQKCTDLLSLVAVMNNRIVGHILFSPVIIQSKERSLQGMGLAPMAVLPEHQRQGVGSELVHAGIEEMKRQRCPFVIVLGHPEYYPRFGFERASAHRIRCEWDVPDDAFMILVLNESELQGVSGMAKYRPEFSEDE